MSTVAVAVAGAGAVAVAGAGAGAGAGAVAVAVAVAVASLGAVAWSGAVSCIPVGEGVVCVGARLGTSIVVGAGMGVTVGWLMWTGMPEGVLGCIAAHDRACVAKFVAQ